MIAEKRKLFFLGHVQGVQRGEAGGGVQPGHDATRYGELTSFKPDLCTMPIRVVTVCSPSDRRGEVGVKGGSEAVMEVVWGVNLP